MRQLRTTQEVLFDWIDELSHKLDRPADSIRLKGLGATDFSAATSVEIRYPTGMLIHIDRAFALIRPSDKIAAVFSEHDGYLEFDLIEDCAVVEIHEDFYIQH